MSSYPNRQRKYRACPSNALFEPEVAMQLRLGLKLGYTLGLGWSI